MSNTKTRLNSHAHYIRITLAKKLIYNKSEMGCLQLFCFIQKGMDSQLKVFELAKKSSYSQKFKSKECIK